ncbi:MAG: DUF4142 domain-containing protein [Acidobacteriota bacterium]|nr:MAG: DUF4142 domain-containing protein [Acidobacteriota bacterium]
MRYRSKRQLLAATLVLAFAVAGIAVSALAATGDEHDEMTDANIAAIVSVAGKLDIAYGKIAMSKSKNEKVREFADRMVTDHSAVQNAAEKLLKKLGVTPVENDTSRSLAENGEKVKAKLRSLKEAEFDKFYIDNEVAYHELVVNAIENVLIKSARNAELKATLESVLPLFTRHLEHARSIQSEMNGEMGGSHKMGH